MPDAINKKVHHISETSDGESSFVFRTANQDLFVRTGRQIIESCQLGISVEVWIQELEAMVREVASWCALNQAQVRSCYCVPERGMLTFFFSPKTRSCDFDLADKLSDLNVELVRGFNVGMVELLQVPWEEADRFLDPESTTLIYGEHFKPPKTVDA